MSKPKPKHRREYKIVIRSRRPPSDDFINMMGSAFNKSLGIPVYGSTTTAAQLRRIRKSIAEVDLVVAFYPHEHRTSQIADFLFVKARQVWERMHALGVGRLENLTVIGVQCEDRTHADKLRLLIDDKMDEYRAAYVGERARSGVMQ